MEFFGKSMGGTKWPKLFVRNAVKMQNANDKKSAVGMLMSVNIC